MDNEARRRDEAEVLASMYGDDFFQLSPTEWVFRCSEVRSELTILLPLDYPSRSAPELQLDLPGRSDLEEARGSLLEGFQGEEFCCFIAERFFDLCARGGTSCAAEAPEADEPGGAGGLASAAGTASVEVDTATGKLLSSSLRNAGFQEHGSGLFAHGELGVFVELGASLLVSVDGVDAIDALLSWLRQHVAADPRGFGTALLDWTQAQRADEEESLAADAAQAPEESHLSGITLTGNAAWKARLQAGETVAFRGGGNSLHPRIKSGECCKYAPVFSHDDVKEKDIVFCQIKGRYWGHMVKRKTFVGGAAEYEYTISNIHGWENGTCTLPNIYGKVIDHWK